MPSAVSWLSRNCWNPTRLAVDLQRRRGIRGDAEVPNRCLHCRRTPYCRQLRRLQNSRHAALLRHRPSAKPLLCFFILRGVRLLAHRRNLAEAGLLLRLTELRMLHRRLERRARLFCLRLPLCGACAGCSACGCCIGCSLCGAAVGCSLCGAVFRVRRLYCFVIPDRCCSAVFVVHREVIHDI